MQLFISTKLRQKTFHIQICLFQKEVIFIEIYKLKKICCFLCLFALSENNSLLSKEILWFSELSDQKNLIIIPCIFFNYWVTKILYGYNSDLKHFWKKPNRTCLVLHWEKDTSLQAVDLQQIQNVLIEGWGKLEQGYTGWSILRDPLNSLGRDCNKNYFKWKFLSLQRDIQCNLVVLFQEQVDFLNRE